MHRWQRRHPIVPIQPRIPALNKGRMLPATPALPTVPMLPATPTLAPVPTLPATAALATVAALPATAMLSLVETLPVTARWGSVICIRGAEGSKRAFLMADSRSLDRAGTFQRLLRHHRPGPS
jgi:hypothetical protein